MRMKLVYSCVNDRLKMSEEKPDCNETCPQKMSDGKCGFVVSEQEVLRLRQEKKERSNL